MDEIRYDFGLLATTLSEDMARGILTGYGVIAHRAGRSTLTSSEYLRKIRLLADHLNVIVSYRVGIELDRATQGGSASAKTACLGLMILRSSETMREIAKLGALTRFRVIEIFTLYVRFASHILR